MLTKENFTLEHIVQVQQKSKCDPSIVERVIYAFGLLEALCKVNLPFVFKGGTSLMLLLDKSTRLSTDIDITVLPNTNLDYYLNKVQKIFPFLLKEEDVRNGRNKIIKRHFKFYYDSPYKDKQFYIILDVVFQEKPYYKTIKKDIYNELLINNGDMYKVEVPSVELILGDKLTAFAPTTTGIPYGINKELEIIKQMYDVCSLIDYVESFNDVYLSYIHFVKIESDFRAKSFIYKDVLKDTINTCLSIISRGKFLKSNYLLLLQGIKGLNSHLYGNKYSGEKAAEDACKILYFCVCLYNKIKFETINDIEKYRLIKNINNDYKYLFYMKKINLKAFGYIVKSIPYLDDIMKDNN